MIARSYCDETLPNSRRQTVVHDTYNTLESILNSKQVSQIVRLRIFRAYIESIFLYNSELWTLTKTLENTIDSFHRRLLRKMIHVKWPRTISNKDLYERTHMIPWSKTINRRRLTWFGHLLRLPSDTPAREALRIYATPTEKPSEKPKTIWLSTIFSDLKCYSDIQIVGDIGKDLERLELISINRKEWARTVDCTISAKLMQVH